MDYETGEVTTTNCWEFGELDGCLTTKGEDDFYKIPLFNCYWIGVILLDKYGDYQAQNEPDTLIN